jgi:hypothetical protein
MTSISAALTQADRDAVMNAIATIKAKLPFLFEAQNLKIRVICSIDPVLGFNFGVKRLKFRILMLKFRAVGSEF